MESLTRGPSRFSVEGLRDSFNDLVDRALTRAAQFVRENGGIRPDMGILDIMEVEDERAITGELVEETLSETLPCEEVGVEEVLVESEPKPRSPSPKRLAVKAAVERRKAEILVKAELRQYDCMGERKRKRNQNVSMKRRAGRYRSSRKNS